MATPQPTSVTPTGGCQEFISKPPSRLESSSRNSANAHMSVPKSFFHFSRASSSSSSRGERSVEKLLLANGNNSLRAENSKKGNVETERLETFAGIEQFELLNEHRLAFTFPSTAKIECTASVAGLDDALRAAQASISDMCSIGLSGLRLTGDHEKEYQFFPRREVTANNIESLAAKGSTKKAWNSIPPQAGSVLKQMFAASAIQYLAPSGLHTQPPHPPPLAVGPRTDDDERPLSAASCASRPPVIASNATSRLSHSNKSGGAYYNSVRAVGHSTEQHDNRDGTEAPTVAGAVAEKALQQSIPCSATREYTVGLRFSSRLEDHNNASCKTPSDRTAPKPEAKEINKARGSAGSDSSDASSSLRNMQCCQTVQPPPPTRQHVVQRPVSARVYPSVRQLKMYPAPLHADVPVAPHLSAVMKWCRNADALRRDPCLRHLRDQADKESAAPASPTSKSESSPTTMSMEGMAMFSSTPPRGAFPESASSSTSPQSTRIRVRHIVRTSKHLPLLLQEVKGSAFESHLIRFRTIVALWFEFCNKNEKGYSEYCLAGSMGNTPSRFVTFFRAAFQDIFTTTKNGDELYDLLNYDCLEQLTFGRFFFQLYLVLSLDHDMDVMTAGGAAAFAARLNNNNPSNSNSKAVDGATLEMTDSIFAATAMFANTMTKDHFKAFQSDPITQRVTRGSSIIGGATDFPTILEYWFSTAGRTLFKKCRTINVFHIECIVTSILTLINMSDFGDHADALSEEEGPGNGTATSPVEDRPAAEKPGAAGRRSTAAGAAARKRTGGAQRQHSDDYTFGLARGNTVPGENSAALVSALRRDVTLFRGAVGSDVEVMADTAKHILLTKTIVLGKLLTSDCARDAEDELNNIADTVVHKVNEMLREQERNQPPPPTEQKQKSVAVKKKRLSFLRSTRDRNELGV